MPNWHKTYLGMLRANVLVPMTTYTSAALSTEILEDALLNLDRVTTCHTVLAINAAGRPERSVSGQGVVERPPGGHPGV